MKSTDQTARQRRLQCSLRTVMLVTLLISVGLASQLWRHQAERRKARAIEQRLERVQLVWSEPAWMCGFRPAGSRTIFSRVTEISIEDELLTVAGLRSLAIPEFTSLRSVYLECPNLAETAICEFGERLLPTTQFEAVIFEELEVEEDEPRPSPIYCVSKPDPVVPAD